MDTYDLIAAKITTIEALNNGNIELANSRISVTTTLNNLLQVFITQFPEVSADEVEVAFPRLTRWFDNTTIRVFDRASLDAAHHEGLHSFIPILVVRYLLRNQNLDIGLRHMSDEFRQFNTRYQAVYARMD